MDLFTALKERSSCRDFLTDEIDPEVVKSILKAGVMAPSPLNTQPWNFVVITNPEMKNKIHANAEESKKWAIGKSGWKWLESYSVDFLKEVPVIIAVTGDRRKSGVDTFHKNGPVAYQHACAAAIQNILLAAHAKGLASLWYTMFDKDGIKDLLKIEENQVCLALICIGKAAKSLSAPPRKDVESKIRYIE